MSTHFLKPVRLIKIIGFGAGLALIAIILINTDLGLLVSGIKLFGAGHLALICSVQLITLLLIISQWRMVAWALGNKISFRTMTGIYMAGTVVESITPAVKAGGEATKILLLAKHKIMPAARATALVAGQKILTSLIFGLFCVLSMTWFYLTVSTVRFLTVQLFIAAALSLFFPLIFVLFLSGKFRNALFSMPFIVGKKDSINEFLQQLKFSLLLLARSKRLLSCHILSSIVIWLSFPFTSWYICRVLGYPAGFIESCYVTYLSYLAAMLPLFPGGTGSYEGAAIALFSSFGVTAQPALVVAVLFRLASYWFVLLAGLLWICVTHLGTSYRKHLPNMLTLLNLGCGLAAIGYSVSNPGSMLPVFLILGCGLLDASDGFLARKLKAESEIGKQLDSLSDLVSFGLAPVVLIYTAAPKSVMLQMALLVFVLAGAYRLARYNCSGYHPRGFTGLPITAGGIVLCLYYLQFGFLPMLVHFFVVTVLAWLMISHFRVPRINFLRSQIKNQKDRKSA